MVTDNGALDIGDVTSGAILTLDDGTTVTGDGSGTLTINAGDTLDIEAGTNGPGATLDGVDGDRQRRARYRRRELRRDPDAGRRHDDHRRRHRHADDQQRGNTLDIEAGSNGPGSGATLDGVNGDRQWRHRCRST